MSRTFENFGPFLTALATQLRTNAGGTFAANCVQLSMVDEFPRYIQGTPLAAIIPFDFKSLTQTQDSAGTELTIWDGQIKIKIVVLNTLDPAFSDPDALTDPSNVLGLYTIVDKVIDSLQMFDPCDGSNNSFLIEPMRLISGSRPLRDAEHSQYTWIDLIFNYRQNELIT